MTKTPCFEAGELWLADNAADRHEAMRLCQPCPEIQSCLMGAIQRREMFGVWGGRDFSHSRTRPELAPKAPPLTHGTQGGYKAHRRKGEAACDACLEANRVAAANRRAQARRAA